MLPWPQTRRRLTPPYPLAPPGPCAQIFTNATPCKGGRGGLSPPAAGGIFIMRIFVPAMGRVNTSNRDGSEVRFAEIARRWLAQGMELLLLLQIGRAHV